MACLRSNLNNSLYKYKQNLHSSMGQEMRLQSKQWQPDTMVTNIDLVVHGSIHITNIIHNQCRTTHTIVHILIELFIPLDMTHCNCLTLGVNSLQT